jgi:flagellar biosynthesis protein FlhA
VDRSGQRDHAIAEGFLTVDARTVIATHLNQLLGERPQAMLGPDEVRDPRRVCASVRRAWSKRSIQSAVARALTRLFRALLEDGVSIAHPLPILAALGQAVQQTTDHDRLVDLVRAELGPMIVGRVCGPTDRLPVVTLDASLESMIVQGMQDPVTGQPVIEPDLARGIGERISSLIAERGPGAISPALVVQPRARGRFPRPAGPGAVLPRAVDFRTAAKPADRGDRRHRRRGDPRPSPFAP